MLKAGRSVSIRESVVELPSIDGLSAAGDGDQLSTSESRQLLPCASHASAASRVDTGSRRQTSSQRVQVLFENLMVILDNEWRKIRSLNLGVRSGTGVVDDVLMREVQKLAAELHVVCVNNDHAAETLGRLALKLDKPKLQQLQVLLDITDHQHLSDYVRLSVYNTSNVLAQPVDVRTKLRRHKKGKDDKGAASAGQAVKLGRFKPAREDEFLRFAGYLPRNHPLSLHAYELLLDRLPETPVPVAVVERSLTPEAKAALEAPVDPAQKIADAKERMARRRGVTSTVNARYWRDDVEALWLRTCRSNAHEEPYNAVLLEEPVPAYKAAAATGLPSLTTSPNRLGHEPSVWDPHGAHGHIHSPRANGMAAQRSTLMLPRAGSAMRHQPDPSVSNSPGGRPSSPSRARAQSRTSGGSSSDGPSRIQSSRRQSAEQRPRSPMANGGTGGGGSGGGGGGGGCGAQASGGAADSTSDRPPSLSPVVSSGEVAGSH